MPTTRARTSTWASCTSRPAGSPKAREHLAVLERLCPQGCEEREDLREAIAAATIQDQLTEASGMKPDLSAPFSAAGLAIGRLLLAALFILEGWSKLRGYEAAAAYMDRYGVTSALLPAAIALELGGGLMLAVGWQTRLAALALAAFSVLAAVLFHGHVSTPGTSCTSKRTSPSPAASWCSRLPARGIGRSTEAAEVQRRVQ